MTLRPDPDRTLADGVIVETVLRARLLGMPVLRVEGVVLIAPAAPSPASVQAPASATAPTQPAILPGGELALARRLLVENTDRLRRLR